MKKKGFLLLALTMFLLWGALPSKFFHAIKETLFYLQTVERYRAKEVCSCHFNVGRELEWCKKDWEVKSWYPYFLAVDEQNRSLSVGFFRKRAQWVSTSVGCQLLN